MERNKILIIDDDPEMSALVCMLLSNEGYACTASPDGEAGLEHLQEEPVDLVILDLVMPGLDGWEVVRRLRQRHRVPVIVLSASSRIEEIVRSLDSGADDFIIKPFDPEELRIRVRVKLQDRAALEADRPPEGDGPIEDGRLRINLEGQSVHLGDRPVQLTKTERSLLMYLVVHEGRTCTHGDIMKHLWGSVYRSGVDDIHGYVHRIRRKLAEGGAVRNHIQTDRSKGYRFVR